MSIIITTEINICWYASQCAHPQPRCWGYGLAPSSHRLEPFATQTQVLDAGRGDVVGTGNRREAVKAQGKGGWRRKKEDR